MLVFPTERIPDFVLIQNETTEAIAVAWLDGKICVLCSSRMVYIFPDHEPFSNGIVDIDLSRHSVFHPTDMVAYAANQTLYISNANDCKIYEFEVPTSTTVKPIAFTGRLKYRPKRLSLSHPNQLVILQESKDTKAYLLGCCSSNTIVEGSHNDDLCLPVEVRDPQHAIQLANSDFFVAYCSNRVQPGLACMGQFARDGNTLQLL